MKAIFLSILPILLLHQVGAGQVKNDAFFKPRLRVIVDNDFSGDPDGLFEYKDLSFPPPNGSPWEYNLNIDTAAARFIFNHSQMRLWQIPRNAYRQCLVSMAELQSKVRPCGKAGNFLYEALAGLLKRAAQSKWNLGETYVLGDSPLVLLTALQSSFEPDASSSTYVIKKAPLLNMQGGYEENGNGRDIRVYTFLDTRLMFDDFFSKMKALK